jgi:tRNA(fMet)-specific endonuclease VapC
MEARYLLDTNICIYIQRNKAEGLLRRFQALRTGEAALSVITFGELLYGAAKSKQSDVAVERLRQLTSLLPVLPIPAAAAEWYGAIYAELERSGQMVGNNDLWIAAHAKAESLTLVTNNEREFRRVRGLKVQNWAVT